MKACFKNVVASLVMFSLLCFISVETDTLKNDNTCSAINDLGNVHIKEDESPLQ